MHNVNELNIMSKKHTKLFYLTVLGLQRSKRDNLNAMRLQMTWKIGVMHSMRLFEELVLAGLVQSYDDKSRELMTIPKVFRDKVDQFIVTDEIKSKFGITDQMIEAVLIK